ncbi:MAG TPA: hypothetical protein P5064_02850 [Clostridia bacterium]|nr:hypothetical protein [Clostridia bacterium]HOM34371.1 hypothetical protein [Clostridia bacterium]HOR89323.1 hypothetical protein [Clostridia bacterium]HOT70561.1 hypothetical protein [Clostridia bacterium]HPL08225.1 hypothetical protein [Clostridia bacterium]
MKAGYLDLYKWENVTDFFTEKQRHYSNTYMEINEVYDDAVEVSLFSSKDGMYEIYFSYDRFYGIIYVEAENAESKREEIKIELAREYEKHKQVTNEFIRSFVKKHKVCLPNDIFFDASKLFGL